MLGEQITEQVRQRIYLNLKEGAVVQRAEDGIREFSYVEGALKAIYRRERTFNGESVQYWYVDLSDAEGNYYSIGFAYSSNVFKSLVLALASAPEYGDIRIRPYVNKGFDKVAVYANGTKLDWIIRDLPPIGTIQLGEKSIKDDTKRMELIEGYVSQINGRITANDTTKVAGGASATPEVKAGTPTAPKDKSLWGLYNGAK